MCSIACDALPLALWVLIFGVWAPRTGCWRSRAGPAPWPGWARRGFLFIFYSILCCIICLTRRAKRGWDTTAYPRPACWGGEMLGLASTL